MNDKERLEKAVKVLNWYSDLGACTPDTVKKDGGRKAFDVLKEIGCLMDESNWEFVLPKEEK